MKLLLVPVFLAVWCIPAFGQLSESGVYKRTDEFTGKTTCRQIVTESSSALDGISLTQYPDDVFPEIVVRVSRAFDGGNSLVNPDGSADTTKIYMIFGDSEPVNYSANLDYVDTELKFETIEVVNTALAIKVMFSSGDIRVRFSTSKGSADFTINQSVATDLAAGFGQECL